MGAYESGQSFLAGVLAKLTPEQQAQAKAIFEAPEAKEALTILGDGVLARTDYSKQMDGLRQKQTELDQLYERNTTWFGQNEAALQEYLRIKPEYETLKGKPTAPPTTPSSGLDESAIQKLLDERINQASVDVVGLSAWAATKATEHYQMFQEVLPVQTLINDAITARKAGKPVTIDEVYVEKYGPRLKEKADAAEAARIDKLVQEKLAAERAASPGLPFPVRTEASVLDVLEQKTDPTQFTAAAAAAEYLRLQHARG